MMDRRTGVLPVWVRCAVACAAVLTMIVAVAGPQALLDAANLESEYDVGWFRSGIAVVLGLWIAMCLFGYGRLSGWLRLAVLLPVAHLVALAIAWADWAAYSDRLPPELQENPMMAALPMSWAVLGLAATCALGGRAIAWRRGRDWVQVATMIALLQLVLLGLWLPIITNIWVDGQRTWYGVQQVLHSRPLLAVVLVPPAALALAIAAVAQRDRSFLVRRGGALAIAAGMLIAIAIALRARSTYCASRLYAELAYVPLAAALTALGALGALAGALAWRARRARRALARDARRQSGELRSEHTAGVGYVAITSWLRGPDLGVAPCSVATPAGELLVPGGAELVAHLPLESTLLRTGEHVSVLRAGERVIAGGYAPAPDGHPFRDASGLVPARVRVAPERDDGNTATDLALALWRPCVAYLLIVATIALPAVWTVFDDEPPAGYYSGGE
jgi:hypothetical protein